VVLKPAEFTSLTALRFAELCQEIGLPVGVVNIITGDGRAGESIVAHPDVDKIAFTGSLEVGKVVMREGADTLKRVTLELGGKSPNIFFADAAFDEAVEGTCNGIFWNQGEICSAGSRVLVEQSVYDTVLQAMVHRARQVRLGDGLADDTTMGPLVSKEQQQRVERYIEIGQGEAKLAIMGQAPSDPRLAGGFFVPPTIFADATNDVTIAREEIFGPVMTVIPFSDADEVIALSNDNDYGLAAAVWTRDIKKALRTARALRAGIVWINDTQPAPTEAPWGGYKQSGVGRELGPEGIDDYLETKHIYVNLTE
jgi:acyl-CoA reductase-like NAD-dependent aldehyde dehydrogenase